SGRDGGAPAPGAPRGVPPGTPGGDGAEDRRDPIPSDDLRGHEFFLILPFSACAREDPIAGSTAIRLTPVSDVRSAGPRSDHDGRPQANPVVPAAATRRLDRTAARRAADLSPHGPSDL